MKWSLTCFLLGLAALFSFMPRTVFHPEEWPVYEGADLGVHYTARETRFKVWAPKSASVTLRIYDAGEGGKLLRTVSLARGEQGTWYAKLDGDLKGRYYTFQMVHDGKPSLEVPDPYAVAVGVNGKRGMVADLAALAPAGWNADRRVALKNPTDAVIYELHVRDLSMNPNSGIRNKGKYLGLVEGGTKSPDGQPTGIDHIKALGVTHVHLLPVFDHNSIDESKPLAPFNWGYDPLNYNVPEGSYASDARNGRVRIREFRQVVKGMHDRGIGVIMDVVYNHTSDIEHSVFHQFAPGYFHRQWPDGKWANGSACGNETASERAMMRKFMIESVTHWARDYHIDGFRFDLMGLHDIETMNAISDALHRIDPSILIYGEGWTAGDSPLPEAQRAVKKNTLQLRGVAAFSDDIRDALRGPFSNDKESGFISSVPGKQESLKFGIAGSVLHPEINYERVAYSKAPWANSPGQTVSYVSCHDDPTLFDRIRLSNPGISEQEQIAMDKLAQVAVLTSQGIAFLHAGEELLRTKGLRHNTYNAPDSVNALDWSRKKKHMNAFRYYQGLIALRKAHPAFRLPTAELVRTHLSFIDTDNETITAFQLHNVPGEPWKNIMVILNGSREKATLPMTFIGNWKVVVDGNEVNSAGIRTVSDHFEIPGTSAMVLHQ